MDKKLNPLILHLKYDYYHMIMSGIKTFEYREKKPYWDKRIKDKKEIIFVPGYNLDNSINLKADIKEIFIIDFDDLPEYAKQEFLESSAPEFYAINFELKS